MLRWEFVSVDILVVKYQLKKIFSGLPLIMYLENRTMSKWRGHKTVSANSKKTDKRQDKMEVLCHQMCVRNLSRFMLRMIIYNFLKALNKFEK